MSAMRTGVRTCEEVKGLGASAERKLKEVEQRMLLLEQKSDAQSFRGHGSDDGDIGAKVIQSEGFKALQSGAKSTGQVPRLLIPLQGLSS